MFGNSGLCGWIWVVPAIWLSLCAGCASHEPSDGLDRTLRIVDVAPRPDEGLLPLNPRVEIYFNRYLDTEALTYFNAISVDSGGVRAWERAVYRLSSKRATVVVRADLEPGLYYDITLNPEVLFSVEGYPFAGPASIRFEVGQEAVSHPPAPVPTWNDVAPILAPCHECHDDPEAFLPQLRPAGMVGVASLQEPSLWLVRPGDASTSYLMHKILPDYPFREGTSQPPAWAGLEPLTVEEIEVVERWIEGGAL